MHKVKQPVRYSMAVNAGVNDNDSVTMEIVTIFAYNARGRLNILRNFLKVKYELTRTQANETIRAMGFDDLLPPCVS